MTWNHRVFKQDTPSGGSKAHAPDPKSAEGDHVFFIAECFYDDDGKPELHGTMGHNLLNGETVGEIGESLGMISKALKEPIIELDKEGNFK